MPPFDALRQGSGKQSCITAGKYPCLFSLPPTVHTHQRETTCLGKVSLRISSSLKLQSLELVQGRWQVIRQHVTSWGCREATASMLPTIWEQQRSASCPPPRPGCVGSRDTVPARFQAVASVTRDWMWDMDR